MNEDDLVRKLSSIEALFSRPSQAAMCGWEGWLVLAAPANRFGPSGVPTKIW